MANIISISLNDEILEFIDEIQKNKGYSGRSEVVRAGIRNIIEEEKKLKELSGIIDAVMIVLHNEHSGEEFSKIKHKFHSIVKTVIHQDIKDEKCLEIIILNGKAKDIKDFNDKLQISKKIENTKLIIA